MTAGQERLTSDIDKKFDFFHQWIICFDNHTFFVRKQKKILKCKSCYSTQCNLIKINYRPKHRGSLNRDSFLNQYKVKWRTLVNIWHRHRICVDVFQRQTPLARCRIIELFIDQFVVNSTSIFLGIEFRWANKERIIWEGWLRQVAFKVTPWITVE